MCHHQQLTPLPHPCSSRAPLLSSIATAAGFLCTRSCLLLLVPVVPYLRRTMAIADVFNEAAERVKQLKEASNADRLHLYGYFKQSTIGDVNILRAVTKNACSVVYLCPARWPLQSGGQGQI
eukprot:contig_6386_g1449